MPLAKARALSLFWFKGTDLEMARHTSSWQCDSQQMASTIKLNRPLSIKGRRLYLCYKQYSHYGCIETVWCNDIAQSWKRQKCIFWSIFCISHQVQQAWLYAESLDSHPFISCGKKEYWDTGINSIRSPYGLLTLFRGDSRPPQESCLDAAIW